MKSRVILIGELSLSPKPDEPKPTDKGTYQLVNFQNGVGAAQIITSWIARVKLLANSRHIELCFIYFFYYYFLIFYKAVSLLKVRISRF
jgi:hypothetical protein